jgi:hypothetical protein
MVAPMTLGQLRTAYKRWGVQYREHLVPGRPGAFSPLGIMVHHTAGSDGMTGDAADERVLTQGRSDLPAPLCHDGTTDTGVQVIISTGRANHAGRGDGSVADKIRARRAAGGRPGTDDTDGNALFYGFEVMYSGTRPMAAAQRRGLIRALAAICEHHGWNPLVVIVGHKEWTGRKIDPFDDMNSIRHDVAAAMAAGPGNLEDDMALSTEDKEWITSAIPAGVRAYLLGGPDYRDLGDGVDKSVPLRMLNVAARDAWWLRSVGIPAVLGAVAKSGDVDEVALAGALAPLVSQDIVANWTAEQLAEVARVVNDETDRRERDRLNQPTGTGTVVQGRPGGASA